MRWTFFVILKDYCLNCSLAGIRYLADTKYHITEKLFWFVCLLVSLTGCYHMIEDELEILNNGAVNLVIENMEPDENSIFPSIGVCEMGNTKDTYEKLEDIINNLTPDGEDYAFDVEDFLFRVIFHNLYNFGSVVSYCEPHRNCKDCAKCPNGNYSMYTELVRAPCHQLLQTCIWNKIEFDCCDYFKPLQTSLGKCFLLNSIQIVEKNGPHWLPLLLTKEIGGGKLELEFSKPASVFIINEEEIPHMLLTRLQINLQHEGSLIHIYLGLQNIINYPNVRTVKPDARKCYFPNEQQNSLYKYYSYSTCVTECLKYAQIKTCNCTHHNMIYNS